MTEEKKEIKIFGYPLKDFVILLGILGIGGGAGYFTKDSGVSEKEVKTEIYSHSKEHDQVLLRKLEARVDSTVQAMIDQAVAPKLIADAVGEDAGIIKNLVKYGVENMAKDSINDIWKAEVDEVLQIKRTGCGAFYYDLDKRHVFRHCGFGDLYVMIGKPADRSDIISCKFVYTPDGYSIVFPSLAPIKYVPKAIIHGS